MSERLKIWLIGLALGMVTGVVTGVGGAGASLVVAGVISWEAVMVAAVMGAIGGLWMYIQRHPAPSPDEYFEKR